MLQIPVNSCQRGCRRKCMSHMLYTSLIHHRKEFWGKMPSALERRRKMKTAVEGARKFYISKASEGPINPDDYPDQLIFTAVDGTIMCEQAFVCMLGLATVDGFKSKTWTSVRNEVIGK